MSTRSKSSRSKRGPRAGGDQTRRVHVADLDFVSSDTLCQHCAIFDCHGLFYCSELL